MPRLKDPNKYLEEHKRSTNWNAFDLGVSLSQKRQAAAFHKPSRLFHGSPYKIKKGEKLRPTGPAYFGKTYLTQRPALHATTSFKEAAKVYSKASDSGGINKTRYGKDITLKFFATKGYVYKIRPPGKGWTKQYHGAGLTTERNHWMSYKPQGFDERYTIRHRGKVPLTRNESILGAVAVGTVLGGSYYYYRRRKNRMERVRNSRRRKR